LMGRAVVAIMGGRGRFPGSPAGPSHIRPSVFPQEGLSPWTPAFDGARVATDADQTTPNLLSSTTEWVAAKAAPTGSRSYGKIIFVGGALAPNPFVFDDAEVAAKAALITLNLRPR
jgi:hypothetical protein